MLFFFFLKQNARNNISNINNCTNFKIPQIAIMVSEGKNQVNRITLVNMFICALDYLL